MKASQIKVIYEKGLYQKALYNKRFCKKGMAVVSACALLVTSSAAVAGCKADNTGNTGTESAFDTQMQEAETDAYEQAKTDLVFWYEDDTYTAFFTEAAKRYFEETGLKVSVEYRNGIDYIGEIYDKTMQEDGFPDVYLIPGDNLEKAYLYGLVSVNKSDMADVGIMEHAIEASAYQGKALGYPLSYNTCLFIYQDGYFAETPTSLQMIIDYSDQNEPAENVDYLLEWDVNDAFYDFPFISNSVTFAKSEAETMNVEYNEDLYNQDLAFFEEILESFSVDASKVSEDGIIENFLAGRTLCAVIDTDSLHRLEGYSYSLMPFPNLNEELSAATSATTDMIVVNDFSEQQDAAADFAKYVTITMSDELHAMSGHYPVIPSENPDATETVANETYETAILVPNSQDAKDFWVNLEETISKYF